jgi:glycine/D-amino acid oxidase-like deaminating enzyme
MLQKMYSYWEKAEFLGKSDFCIIGAGIVGLNTAIYLKQKLPDKRILVLERGVIPEGASSRNAGFACYGSPTELIMDLETHTESEVFALVEKRWQGLQLLRKNLGDVNIGYQPTGGFEIFNKNDNACLTRCLDFLPYLNKHLKEITGVDNCYSYVNNTFGFNYINSIILNKGEGLIHTGNMINSLLKKALSLGIEVWFNMDVTSFNSNSSLIKLEIANNLNLKTNKLIITTNAFSNRLISDLDLKPARAQVLVTEELDNIPFSGGFHYDRGYYYFRNINNRILLGGGRNLDFKAETTTDLKVTSLIQNKLEELLHKVILPNRSCKIEHRWSGIMGLGTKKYPIVKQVEPNVYCAIRMGGMGVALGSLTGLEVAQLAMKD